MCYFFTLLHEKKNPHHHPTHTQRTRGYDVIGVYEVLGCNVFQLVERFKPQFLYFGTFFSLPLKRRKKNKKEKQHMQGKSQTLFLMSIE